jgi:hypothetical protein
MSAGGTNQPLLTTTEAAASLRRRAWTASGPCATAASSAATTAVLRCSLDGLQSGAHAHRPELPQDRGVAGGRRVLRQRDTERVE